MFLNYYDAHDPYLTAEGATHHFGLRPTTATEVAALRDWLRVDHAKLPERTLQVARDGYDDCLTFLDGQLGLLFSELESRGALDNTLIVVTSDHGELFGEHGAFGHGSHLYHEAINVPLVIVAPRRIPSGRVVTTPVSLRDLPATVVDLLGLGESPFPGRSLGWCFKPLAAQGAVPDEFILSETADEPIRGPKSATPARALAYQGKVYIRSKDNREEFYDLAKDPTESRDLTQDPRAQHELERFRDRMKQIDAASNKLPRR
jgi:arylsulfatase A-like enzyme